LRLGFSKEREKIQITRGFEEKPNQLGYKSLLLNNPDPNLTRDIYISLVRLGSGLLVIKKIWLG